MFKSTKYIFLLILLISRLSIAEENKITVETVPFETVIAIENILKKAIQSKSLHLKVKALAPLAKLIKQFENLKKYINETNSIDTDLEFIAPSEYSDITKAGGNVTTAADFIDINAIVKTDGTSTGVIDSTNVFIDNTNNMTGVNQLIATGISLPITSVTAPAITFGTSTTSGIYSDSTDTVSIGSQNTNTITFGPNGTTIPSGKSLTVGGTTTFNNTATFTGTTTFSNTTNITGQLNTAGTTNLNGTINTISGTININGAANLTGATISGSTIIGGTTNLAGTTNITSQTNINSPINTATLNLTGGSLANPAITFNNDITTGIYSSTARNTSFSSLGAQQMNIYATGISATGIYMSGDINMNNNNLNSAGSLSYSILNATTALNASGLNVLNQLNATGTTTLNGHLNCSGAANFSGPLNVTGLTTLRGGLNATGSVNINGTVNATGITFSGNLNMNANNITGVNIINTTGVYLQPGTASLPSASFNGFTGVGLSCTGANTLNICGGGQVNTKISPAGLDVYSGLNFNFLTSIGTNETADLSGARNYILANGNPLSLSAGVNNTIGKTLVVVNPGSSSINVTGTAGNTIVFGPRQCRIFTYIVGSTWVQV